MNNLYPISKHAKMSIPQPESNSIATIFTTTLSVAFATASRPKTPCRTRSSAALGDGKKFAGQSSERTWLTGILRHKVCDQVRRACRDRAVFHSDLPTERDEFESLYAHQRCRSSHRVGAEGASDRNPKRDRETARAVGQGILPLRN